MGTAWCTDGDYRRGPMAVLVDDLFEGILGYRPIQLTPNACRYYTKRALVDRAKALRAVRPMALAGKNKKQETTYFRINALMLAEIALELEEQEGDSSIAILFRDTDGVNSSPNTLWSDKVRSMMTGFEGAGYASGVPMVPRPKSEAWLLCAAKDGAYQACAALEDLPGNDDAPNSAKDQLFTARNGQDSTEELREWLEGSPFDHGAVAAQMPSYRAFHDRLVAVIESCRE
jgi:hypothetical protein